MKNFLKIKDIRAMQILDSRGNPTVQVEVMTEDGYVGKHQYHQVPQQEVLKQLNYEMKIKTII